MRPSREELQAQEYGDELARAAWDLVRDLEAVLDVDAAYFEAVYFLSHITMDVLQQALAEAGHDECLASPLLHVIQRGIVDAGVCHRLQQTSGSAWMLPLSQLERVLELARRHLLASYERQRWYHRFEPRLTNPGDAGNGISPLYQAFSMQLARSAGMSEHDPRRDRLALSAAAAAVAIDPQAFSRGLLRDR